ncbi:MAG: large conductance mechanosensitive channel protein MscL [Saprospiraceae bacterium]
MIQEFKDFIMKGNVLELAVAVIIAGAFGAVITSFTADILMPPIGKALGGVDFNELQYVIDPAVAEVKSATGEVVTAGKDAVAIRYGKWINTIIDFLIIAFILFLIVRSYNKANPEPEPEPAPEPGPTQEELLAQIRDLLAKR